MSVRDGEQLRNSSPAIVFRNFTGIKKADEVSPLIGLTASAYLFTSFSANAELLLIESSEVGVLRRIAPLLNDIAKNTISCGQIVNNTRQSVGNMTLLAERHHFRLPVAERVKRFVGFAAGASVSKALTASAT